jgi:DNA-binding transcriptional LysR family regulator
MALNLQRMLTLKQLRLVSVLGRELNLSRCAEILHSTQPAASRALAQLEEQLQVILFQRTTKRMVPTVAGLSLIQHAHRVLAEIDLAEEDLLGLSGGVSAEMRVGVLAAFSPEVLARAMARSREILPEVLLITQMLPLEMLYEQLLDGRIDLMLAHAELRVDLNLVEVTPLYEEHSTILAGLGHRLHKKKKLSWVDLAQEAWVLPPPHTPLRPKIDRMLSVHRNGERLGQGPDVQTDSSLLALSLIGQTPMLWAIAHQQAKQFEATSQVKALRAPAKLLSGPMCCFRLREERLKTQQSIFMGCLKDSALSLAE